MNGPDACLIVNTSPLIHLAEAGLLHLLQEAAGTIWVPEPVAREIRAYGEDDPTARALNTHDWLEIKSVPSIPDAILAWNLGAGESSVLALAASFPGSTAVIDDLAGWRCAEAMGLLLRGTVRRAGVGGKAGGADRGGSSNSRATARQRHVSVRCDAESFARASRRVNSPQVDEASLLDPAATI